MKKFQLFVNGNDFGVYEGEDKMMAIEAMTQDAGYASIADAAAVCEITEEKYVENIEAVEVES